MRELKDDFIAAGLSVKMTGRYFLKPLSNGQIEKDGTLDLLNVYLELGEEYPEIAG